MTARIPTVPRSPALLSCLRLLGAVAAIALAGAACTRLKPYERGRLAHPTMRLTDNASPGLAHVYAIEEGAAGGASAVEGGCGCN